MSADIDRTLWVGNLSEKITEDLLYELFLQAGPLDKVKIATERDGRQKNFAFITFKHDVSVPYTINLMDGMQVFGRGLKLQSRPGSIHQQQQPAMPQQGMANPDMMSANMQVPMNPYQNSPLSNPHGAQHAQFNNMQMHPHQAPANPYSGRHPTQRNQAFTPGFNRSHTWHGNDLDQQLEQDRNSRDQDRHRDRSNTRRHDDDGGHKKDDRGRHRDHSSGRDDFRNSSSGYHGNGHEDFSEKRQRVLRKQDQMLDKYRHGHGGHRGSPQHQPWHSTPYQRRGRY